MPEPSSPRETFLEYWWSVLRRVPALSWKSVNRVRTIVAVVVMIAFALNRPLGKLISDTWQGVPGKYVLTLVAFFILWEVMQAVYARDGERSAALADAESEAAEAKARMYDGRPLLVFDIVHQPRIMAANTVGRTIFQLKNCGGRPARWVHLLPIKSNEGKFRLFFEPIPLVDTKGEAAVEYSVNFTGRMDERWLWQFLTDNAADTAVTWWDVTIEFRDTDESVQKDIARFCFDVKSGQLFVRAVPYTERGFVPPSSELSE